MTKQELKTLLEKYYNGETTSEEEAILIDYFSNNEPEADFKLDKDYFSFLANEKSEIIDIEDLSDQIWKNIEDSENTKKLRILKYSKFYKVAMAIAASIIIILVSVSVIKFEFIRSNEPILFADTYENPELAYLEAKKALLFVSQKLNKGTNHVQALESFGKGTKDLKLIKNFNRGLDELKPVKSIELADKYIKNN